MLGTALIAGLLAMMVRRGDPAPGKLDYARPDRAARRGPQYDRRGYRVGDWVFVVTLLVIALTGYLLEGVRIAMEHPGYDVVQFGGWVAAQAFDGRSPGDALARLAARALVVPRPAGDRLRRRDPLHQGGAHADAASPA